VREQKPIAKNRLEDFMMPGEMYWIMGRFQNAQFDFTKLHTTARFIG
jgi:hypothetical protein